jgi:hypothetical protein
LKEREREREKEREKERKRERRATWEDQDSIQGLIVNP